MSKARKKQMKKQQKKSEYTSDMQFGSKLKLAVRSALRGSLRFLYFGARGVKRYVSKQVKYCVRYAGVWVLNVFDFKNEPVPLPRRSGEPALAVAALPSNVYSWPAGSGPYDTALPPDDGYVTTIEAIRKAYTALSRTAGYRIAVRGLKRLLAFTAKLCIRWMTGVKMRDVTLTPTHDTKHNYLKAFAGRLVTVGAPVAALLALALVILSASEFTVGVKVTIGGEDVAIIKRQDDFDAVVADVEHYVSGITGEPYALGVMPAFKLVLVERDTVGAGEEALYDTLMSMTDGAFVDGYALYINNAMLGVNTNGSAVRKILDEILSQYTTENPDERIAFVQNVELRPGRYNSRDVVSLSSIETLLYSKTQQEKLYTIQEDDMFSTIAPKVGMKADDLRALNPDVDPTKLREGMEIKVQSAVPLLSVQVMRKIQYTEEIPFDTIKNTTDDQYTTYSKVTQAGVNGEELVTAEVVMVDGVETERVILARDVTLEPVTKVMMVGTKKPPSTAPTGSLRRPFGGTITSRFGARGGTHTGVDLAGKSGSSIVAADGGSVIFAAYNGNYGLLVKIDHGNGMQTWYAHCSKIYVSVGQKVAKGETIAAVGSTGNSTGPHVHFEVRINGVPKNPLNYTG